MLPARALVTTVIASSVLWVGVGAAGTVSTFFGLLPSGVAAVLLPATLSNAVWFGPHVLPATLIAGAVHAGVLALLLRVLLRTGDGARSALVWFAVVLTGFLATAVVDAALLLPDLAQSGRGYTVGVLAQQVAPAGFWGVVWGWLPALLGALAARGGAARDGARRSDRAPVGAAAPARLRGWGPGAAVLLAGGAAAVLALPALTEVPPDAPPITAPSPAPTHVGWARIAPEPVPVDPAACDSADVALSLGAPDAATGHRVLPLRVTNTSGAGCVLDGYADVVFDDAEGDAMDVLVVHGGSFMTTDPGAKRFRLAAGASAVADLGWNAQSAAGEQRVGTVLVSVRPGAERLAASVDLDVEGGGPVALTAWRRAPAG